jgi:predicted methyltransferase
MADTVGIENMADTDITYWTAQTNRWTFTSTKLKAWTESRLSGKVLNACCGVVELDHDTVVRNDLRKAHTLENDRTINGTKYNEGDRVPTKADTTTPVGRLHTEFEKNSFDTIVYDPAFSSNQSKRSYNLKPAASEKKPVHEILNELLKPGGTLLYYGFSSTLFPPQYEYTIQEIAHWNVLGGQYDWYG